MCPSQQRAQPMQPYFTYNQLVIGWLAANLAIAASALTTSLSALRSSSVSTRTPVAGTPRLQADAFPDTRAAARRAHGQGRDREGR